MNSFLQERTYPWLALLPSDLNKFPRHYLTCSPFIWNHCFILSSFCSCKLKYAFSSVLQSAHLLQYLLRLEDFRHQRYSSDRGIKSNHSYYEYDAKYAILYKVTTIESCVCAFYYCCLFVYSSRDGYAPGSIKE